MQDKNKYKAAKYRLVVRFTNTDVICQIFSSDLTHDVCLGSAYSHELKRYGITLGLTNYAAAYATGLLLARRINKKFNLKYEGHKELTGEDFNVEADDGPAPFKAYLDVGLKRTTTGCRVFAALKGACDGGLDIPHNDRRFPGTTKSEDNEVTADPAIVKKYVFGGHVAEYMTKLKEDDEEAYNARFKRYIAAKITPDKLAKLYKDAHTAIRKDPSIPRGPLELGNLKTRKAAKAKDAKYPKKNWKLLPKNKKQRMDRVRQKLVARGVETIYVREKKAIEKAKGAAPVVEEKIRAPPKEPAAPKEKKPEKKDAAAAKPAAGKPAAAAAAKPAAKK